jgi:hypothetical protein
VGWPVGCVVGCPVGWPVGCVVGCPVGWPVGCVVGCPVGWPVGCVVGCPVGISAPDIGFVVGLLCSLLLVIFLSSSSFSWKTFVVSLRPVNRFDLFALFF